jgi:hypothetical protein
MQEFTVFFGWSWSKIEQGGNPSPTSILPTSYGKSLWMPVTDLFSSPFNPNGEPPNMMLATAQGFLHTGTVKTQEMVSMHRLWGHAARLRQHQVDSAWTLCSLLHPQGAGAGE